MPKRTLIMTFEVVVVLLGVVVYAIRTSNTLTSDSPIRTLPPTLLPPTLTSTPEISPTSAIQVEPQMTEIMGSLGMIYEFEWKLSSPGDNAVERRHSFRVTGLGPGSPTRSSRSLFLVMTCEGKGMESFQ
jgi:hypothetical protein